MLRNSVPPLILGCILALVELIAGGSRSFAAFYAVVFVLAALAALRHGRELSEWAVQKTYQVAYWLPEVDDTVES